MIRALTNSQETIDEFLTRGALQETLQGRTLTLTSASANKM